jgi:hypothetical protein
MDAELLALLQQAVAGDRRVQIGNQSVEAHSLKELIAALRYIDDQANGNAPGELRRARVVNPGIVGTDREAD